MVMQRALHFINYFLPCQKKIHRPMKSRREKASTGDDGTKLFGGISKNLQIEWFSIGLSELPQASFSKRVTFHIINFHSHENESICV